MRSLLQFAPYLAVWAAVSAPGMAAAETRLEGFVFTTPETCGAADCEMVSFQIYGDAALAIYDGMRSEVSAERDICMDQYFREDPESGLICFVSDDRAEALCTFGYDFESRKMRTWAGSC